ncbi:hypothetical protein [Pandoraea apista]|uniref:Uncharacterized protein n=1 Tax=Pandoraea apista TaxID=93218 RepID=A0ABX9ZHG9_9BURK|nr:hypothetical protein [Pandoraea apista]PTE02675.1 hypothetical protein C7830_00155 [Pandoraea apista]RRJ27544.1 hypothetical protein EIB05_21530 [Pandoraea apista]RRJ73165.1 hypothetical protein EIL82_22035 [Pandoraea apista]RSD06476.1 hypothetical protein EJB12_21625 [Pandoraea apista]RSD11281.1 hypothetical protein EIZ52_21520 [Pandoraea apista]
MPIVQFDSFPEDEKQDFLLACKRLGIDPATLSVHALREDFPMADGQYRIDRTVVVVRKETHAHQAIKLELDGSRWVYEFERDGAMLK